MNKGCLSRLQRSAVLLLLPAVGLTGCRPGVYELDERELSHPAAARAAASQRAGDIERVIAKYNEILTEHPEMARIHLALAFLYDRPDGDYVRAIYHYQRYLELRPRTEKKEFVAQHIEDARESLAGQYGRGTEYLTKKIETLEQKKEELNAAKTEMRQQLDAYRAEIQDLKQQLVSASEIGLPPAAVALPEIPEPDLPLSETTGPADPPPATTDDPGPAVSRDVDYVIQPRDTLSGLAQRFYGDRYQWRRIYDVNRERIPNPDLLPVGVTIVVPDVPPRMQQDNP